ncbi:MAG: cysteine hydrolase [Propionibacteriaceae bacterium]
MTSAPWLVVIDMQVIFADPESDWATPGFAAIVPAVRSLVEAYAPRVVFTRFVAPETPTGAWVPYYQQWPFALVPPTDRLYDIVGELARPDLPVVSRPTFGKWDAELAGLLGQEPEMVLAGVSTDCCVLSTALAAADAGVRVRVVADACAGVSEQDHQRALDAMSLYGPLIEITHAADLGAPAHEPQPRTDGRG